VSRSELAGRALGGGCEGRSGSARGIVLTSRSVPRRIWERRPVDVGGGEDVLWLREDESQDCWTADWGGDCGGAGAAADVGMGVLCGFGVALAF
jgi:hypothetical protein